MRSRSRFFRTSIVFHIFRKSRKQPEKKGTRSTACLHLLDYKLQPFSGRSRTRPPGAVMFSTLIDPLKAVRAEIVTLCLNEVCRAARLTERIEITERCRQCGNRQASQRGLRDDAAKRWMRLFHH